MLRFPLRPVGLKPIPNRSHKQAPLVRDPQVSLALGIDSCRRSLQRLFRFKVAHKGQSCRQIWTDESSTSVVDLEQSVDVVLAEVGAIHA